MKNSPLILLLFACALSGYADDRAIGLITQEGGSIALGKSVPGSIDLTEDRAFPFLQDSGGVIVGAGGIAGKGRAVGFTHGGFLKPGTITEQSEAAALIINSIRWAAKSANPHVGVHPGISSLAATLEEAGLTVTVFPVEEFRDHKASVYCVIGHEALSDGDIVKLFEFVNDGGGLVTATTPWAFKKKFPDFSKFPANQLLAHAGFQFLPDGYAKTKEPLRIGANDTPLTAPTSVTMKTNVSGGSKSLVAAKRLANETNTLSTSDKSQLIADLLIAKNLQGSALSEFLDELKALNETVGPIIPTKENPVIPGKNPLIDAIMELETRFNETAPAGVMYAIPASSNYPGAVPAAASRVTKELKIDGTWRGWLEGRNAAGWAAKEMRPTGIYAPPGEIVKVTVPARISGEGFEVVIGSYGGGLKNREQWHRYPDWQVTRPVASRVTEISSGLGGLVTIRIPRGAEYDSLDLIIEGGVKAPLYEHGKTDLKMWVDEIRKYEAPWAELASDRMIVAIPTDYIRKLSNPDDVMEIWNAYIDTSAELVQVNRDDYRAERIVFDRQTAAGSMHSSYPVAAHLGSAAEQAVNAESLRKDGNWGFFHEYGHNHQHNLWALPNTGETTCNLWSVYLFEELIGKDRDDTHRAIRPLDRKQRVNTYFSSGANFSQNWSVWTALETYLQIQEEFGWEPFKKVFDEYNKLELDERPRGQDEINDQWVIRLSKACGKNLQPFWATWNLPMSSDVDRALKDLPVWEDHPVARFAKK